MSLRRSIVLCGNLCRITCTEEIGNIPRCSMLNPIESSRGQSYGGHMLVKSWSRPPIIIGRPIVSQLTKIWSNLCQLTFDQLENVWLTCMLVTHCECTGVIMELFRAKDVNFWAEVHISHRVIVFVFYGKK